MSPHDEDCSSSRGLPSTASAEAHNCDICGTEQADSGTRQTIRRGAQPGITADKGDARVYRLKTCLSLGAHTMTMPSAFGPVTAMVTSMTATTASIHRHLGSDSTLAAVEPTHRVHGGHRGDSCREKAGEP